MEQRIVSQEANRYIYFIQEDNVSFYLMIPRSSEVSLVLNIIENVNDDVIKNLQSPANQVYICPVVSSDVLNSVLQNQADSYQLMDVIFSRSLNLSHQILVYNHLNVNNSVYLKDNPSYAMFCSWFLKKYDGRVILLEGEKPTMDFTSSNVMATSDGGSIGNVEQPVNEATVDTSPVVQNTSDNNASGDEAVNQVQATNQGSLGFVSYVLLGVVVAVLSLVFLYFIL